MPIKKSAKATPVVPSATTAIKHQTQNYVYMEKSVTKNLGNFNSTKITIGVTAGVDPSSDDIKIIGKSINILSEKIDKELEEQMKAFEDK